MPRVVVALVYFIITDMLGTIENRWDYRRVSTITQTSYLVILQEESKEDLRQGRRISQLKHLFRSSVIQRNNPKFPLGLIVNQGRKLCALWT
jgi:hypothetical protein